MDILKIISIFKDYGGIIAIVITVLMIFVDLTPPIKLNPIKAICRYLGTSFNSSVRDELEALKQEMTDKFNQLQMEQNAQRQTLDKIIQDQRNTDINRYRWEVVDFENSLINGVKHPREQYRHALDCYEKYIAMMEEIGATSQDEYYRDVKEKGQAILDHYEKYRGNKELLFF